MSTFGKKIPNKWDLGFKKENSIFCKGIGLDCENLLVIALLFGNELYFEPLKSENRIIHAKISDEWNFGLDADKGVPFG